MTNLIFLDIDGVLNSERLYKLASFWTWDLFDSESVRLLNRLVVKHDALIVVSSNWIKTYGLDIIAKTFKKNKIKFNDLGSIPISINYTKEKAIEIYLKNLSEKFKDVNYIILDDELPNGIVNLVKINPEFGFTFDDYVKANKLLNKNV